MRSPFDYSVPGSLAGALRFGGKGGGGGGNNSGGTQTTVSKVELPDWVNNAAQKNLNQAYDVAGKLMGPYGGPRVAGMTDGANADIAALQSNVGSTNPAFSFAQDAAAGVAGYRPDQVNTTSLPGVDLSGYMNPFTKNVIDSGMQAIDTQRRQALNQVGDQANTARAFGGSRQGVVEGVTNAAAALQAGNLAAQLQKENFGNAQTQAQTDLGRNLQAQETNQGANLTGANLNLSGANAVGNLAAGGQSSFLQGAMGGLQGQQMRQQQSQAQLDANRQYYGEQQQFPIQQLQIPLTALGATPYGQTTTTTSPLPPSNGFLTGLGAAASGVGLMGGLLGPGSLLGGSNGVFGAGGILALSDRDEKTDIKKVGKDKNTGLDIFAYRYKGDPKTYPKVVGPMAQDIAKKFPNLVKKVGDRLAVEPVAFSFLGAPVPA